MARRQKQKPRPKKTKRLMLRRLYRRGRIYVPIVALLLLAMVISLPISPPGLAGYIGRTIESRTGLPVSIESVRLRVLAGEVTLRGIQVRDDNGGEAFEVGEIFLSGDFGELIAGKGRWPATVVVDNISELQVGHRGGRIAAEGSLETLLDALARMDKEIDEDEDDPSPLAIFDQQTPSIVIRNTHAVLRSDDPRLDRTRLAIQRIHVPQRIGSAEQVRATFNGVVTAGLSEFFAGSLVYSPKDNRASLDMTLDGIKRDVTIRGFGDVHMAARGITLSLSAHEIAEDEWQLGIDQSFDRFEISEMRTGGERWIEEGLTLRSRGVWDMAEEKMRDATLSIGGDEIDLAMSGQILMTDEHDGQARLRIRRFPAPLIALGQRLARDEGFSVSRGETARLLVDVAIEGPFASIGDMDIDGTVDIAGWSFQHTGWPEAVKLHEARGEITNSTLELSNLRLSAGTLDASGSLRIPVTVPEGETRPGRLELSLRGTPETAFDFLRAHGITETVVTAATVPLSINVQSEFRMERQEELLEPKVELDSLSVRGDVTWGEGMLHVDRIPGAIMVQPGGLVFDDSSLQVESLAIAREDLSVRLAGRIDLPEPRVFESMGYEWDLHVAGQFGEIVELAGDHVELPAELDPFDGMIEVGGRVRGVLAPEEWPQYELTARIREGRGVATFQINPVRFHEVDAEIHATNDHIEIRRLQTRMQDDTLGIIKGEITREGAFSTVDVETTLETVTYILPHELDEMVMAGRARAEGGVRLEVNRALPEAPDVLMAWVGALSNPQEYKVHVTDDAALRLRIDAELTPLEPATLFHRDFPQRVDNIRGIVRADELGFILESNPSRWGDAEDVIISGRVTLGHIGPLNVSFEAIAPELDLNDWIDGWGEQEWAKVPSVRDQERARREAAGEAPRTTDAQDPPSPRLRTTINGRLKIGRTEFLTVRAENLIGELNYEAWAGAENKLRVDVEEATAYGGSLTTQATLLFPDGALPRIRAIVNAVEVGVNGFMADLRKCEEQTVGKFTGKVTLEGELVDYSTWVGGGEYQITESKFIGDQVLTMVSRTLRLGFEQTQADTTWKGTGSFRDEVVSLPDLVVSNNEFNLVANGTVGFDGALDFSIAVEFLGNRIDWIPVVRRFAPLVNRFTDFLVSVKLDGTVYDPRTRVVPLYLDIVPLLPTAPSGASQ